MGAFRRVILIVLDSVGIGAMPDAADYGDEGSDTLGNLSRVRPCRLPNLQRLGLGNIRPIANLDPAPSPAGAYGKAALRSPGKDTTTGHWEMAGVILDTAFPTYPAGFPPELIQAFETAIGRKILGNVPASGTEIIQRLGEEHRRTGSPIVYTSADSVFQITAHEDVVPLEELYRMCRIARAMLQGKHRVGRVIARPFVGAPGSFERGIGQGGAVAFKAGDADRHVLERESEIQQTVHLTQHVQRSSSPHGPPIFLKALPDQPLGKPFPGGVCPANREIRMEYLTGFWWAQAG